MRVFFLQPLVPHYRAPFFRRLAAEPGLDLVVHTSPETPGQSLRSVPLGPEVGFDAILHPCTLRAGGRLYWQADLRFPVGFGRGDVYVMPGSPRYPRNFLLAAEAKARGAAVVWFSHGYGVGISDRALLLRRTAAARFDHVVLYTDAEVAGWKAAGFPHDRITGMNNALEQGPIRAARDAVSAADVVALRTAHGLVGRRLLLLVGRLTEKAGAELLIDALPRLPLDVTAVLIGGGESADALAARVARLGLADRVRQIGPLYDEAALAPWFRAASVFVYPGAIGLSIHHAFGYGLPVVTHGDVRGQMPEFGALNPGVNGEVFPPGDAAGLARVLGGLLGDDTRRGRLAAGARRTVETGWNIDDMVSRMAGALRAAVSHRTRHGMFPGDDV